MEDQVRVLLWFVDGCGSNGQILQMAYYISQHKCLEIATTSSSCHEAELRWTAELFLFLLLEFCSKLQLASMMLTTARLEPVGCLGSSIRNPEMCLQTTTASFIYAQITIIIIITDIHSISSTDIHQAASSHRSEHFLVMKINSKRPCQTVWKTQGSKTDGHVPLTSDSDRLIAGDW